MTDQNPLRHHRHRSCATPTSRCWPRACARGTCCPSAAKLDAVGYHSLEVWGGATFDSCLRFLNEDPWERLRAPQGRAAQATPLQMLLRGQNIVGYRHYADDVVEQLRRAGPQERHRHLPHLRRPERHPQHADGHAGRQAPPAPTSRPPSATPSARSTPPTPSSRWPRSWPDMGADSICIKDMAGLLTPYDAYELVGRLKAEVGPAGPAALPLHQRHGHRGLPEGGRGGRRRRGHRHLQHGAGLLPAAHREHRQRSSRARRATPAWTWRCCPRSRATSPASASATAPSRAIWSASTPTS